MTGLIELTQRTTLNLFVFEPFLKVPLLHIRLSTQYQNISLQFSCIQTNLPDKTKHMVFISSDNCNEIVNL